jgi:small conductance mechanosensitive channel
MPTVDLSNAWKTVEKIANDAISLMPKLVIALVVFGLFLLVASFVQSILRRVLERRTHHRNVAILLGQLANIVIVILGFLIALSLIAPSFRAGDLIKVLGIGSVAIGFAFQNILQNFLAGILILLQEPFELGDWISVTGIEGTVEDIQTRATLISTKEGHRVVIPNALLFTNPVSVGRQAASL